MKGLFIPEITTEMFRNGCLESIEALMAECKIYDIDYQQPCEDAISRKAVLDKLNKLIEVERLQGTDEMGYGRERVSAYECMIHSIESEYLYPSVNPQQPCEDCISRENLLKAFKDECRGECDSCPHFRKDDGEYKCRLIADFPSVTPKKKTCWIPVSERLPERYKEVIITDIETSDTYLSRYIGNRYWECDNGLFKDRIIAWMPLPEPYKAESEEV